MNHFLVKIKNIEQIKKQLMTYPRKKVMNKKRHHKTSNITCYSLINSKTFDFRIRNSKLFRSCFIRLNKLENDLKKFNFSKKVKIVIRKEEAKAKIKIRGKVAKMFHKKPYVFVWNVAHPRAKEMFIRHEYSNIWYFVKLDLKF